MAEWSIAAVLKTAEAKVSGSSNLPLSAPGSNLNPQLSAAKDKLDKVKQALDAGD